MRVNDLVVQGEGAHDHVPEPCQTFESAGYPADLLEEVSIATPVVWLVYAAIC